MTISHNPTQTQIDALAVGDVIEAASAVELTRHGPSHDLFVQAQTQLCDVVQRANYQGLSWQSIGDALGIARGNAYQRYRRRPEPRPLITECTVPVVTPPGP